MAWGVDLEVDTANLQPFERHVELVAAVLVRLDRLDTLCSSSLASCAPSGTTSLAQDNSSGDFTMIVLDVALRRQRWIYLLNHRRDAKRISRLGPDTPQVMIISQHLHKRHATILHG